MRKNTHTVIAVLFSTLLMAGGTLAAVKPLVEPPTVEEAAALQQRGAFDDAAAAWSAIVEAEPDNGVAWFNLGYSLHAGGHLDKAKEVHEKAASFDRFKGIALYNLGCAHALLGETDEAFEALAASMEAGFDVRGNAGGDPDLDSLRQDARYAALMGATSESDSRPRGGGGGGGFSMAGGKDRLGELFETVGMHMQPIIEELMPEFEQRVGMLMQEAQKHAHELFGMLKQRVEENDELVSALQEIHQILSEDPQIGPLLEKAHAWMEQNMGGGGRGASAPHSSSAGAPATAPGDSAGAPSGGDLQPFAQGITLPEAQRLQQAGQHQAAAHAFAVLAKQQPDNAGAAFGYAYNLHMSGAHESAIAAHKTAAEFEQIRGISLYNLACACALTGRTDEAIEALKASAEAGFDVGGSMGDDTDLDSLRSDQRFIELQEQLGGAG